MGEFNDPSKLMGQSKSQNSDANNVHKSAQKDFEDNLSSGPLSSTDAELVWNKLSLELNEREIEKLNNIRKELESGLSQDEAEEKIDELRSITSPVISVPQEYLNEIVARGYMEAVPNWTGHKIITATIGRKPFIRGEEKRVFFKVKPHIKVVPKFTEVERNLDKSKSFIFHGAVVVLPEHGQQLLLGRDLEQL